MKPAITLFSVIVLTSGIVYGAIPGAHEPNGPLRSTTGPKPPPEVVRRDAVRIRSVPGDPKVIPGVPAYLWRHGCGPTAVGMVVGYYDGQSYNDLIRGDASSQTNDVNQAIASGGTADNPNPPGSEKHYEDYSCPEDGESTGILTDDYITKGRLPHTNDSIGDYMDTSKSTLGNCYGGSLASDVVPAFIGYVNQQDSNYHPTYGDTYWASDVLWSVLTNEIDNNRPMVFLVDCSGDGTTDHFVTVIGYDTPTNQYGCYDTWEPVGVIRWETFQGMASGSPWGIAEGWSFQLQNLIITPVYPTADINVPQNKFFEFTSDVSCKGRNCGDVDVGLVFGLEWTAKESNRNWTGVCLSSTGQYQTAVVYGGQIYISSDYGNTWTAKESNRNWYGVCLSSTGQYQTAVVSGGQIYISSDYGDSWAAKESNRNWRGAAMSSDGLKQTAVANNGQIYISSDYGNTWTAKESSRSWTGVCLSSTSQYQTAVVSGGQIYISSDYGDTWTAKESGRNWQGAAMSSDGLKQTAVVYNGQIYISSDYGNTWTARESNRAWRGVAMSSTGQYRTAWVYGGQIYAIDYASLAFYTTDNNPQTVNLSQGQSQLVTWHVNPTGPIGHISEFSAYANLVSDPNVKDETDKVKITIVNPADITGNGKVDCDDLKILAEQWLQVPGAPSADIAPIPADGIVNFLDYAVLANYWLKEQ